MSKSKKDPTEIAIIFKKFLIKNNALENYLEYTDLDYNFPRTLVSSQFTWAYTKQGSKYWSKINKKWKKICDKLGV